MPAEKEQNLIIGPDYVRKAFNLGDDVVAAGKHGVTEGGGRHALDRPVASRALKHPGKVVSVVLGLLQGQKAGVRILVYADHNGKTPWLGHRGRSGRCLS